MRTTQYLCGFEPVTVRILCRFKAGRLYGCAVRERTDFYKDCFGLAFSMSHI